MKKISIILIMTILSLCFIPRVDATKFSSSVTFDTDNHWAESDLDTLSSLGIMNGFEGKMNPDAIITRGEFTALITRAFLLNSNEEKKTFSDIDKNHVFYENICGATNAGIIDGFPDGTFRPDNMITREEIMLILSRLNDVPTDLYEVSFNDIAPDYVYVDALANISSQGIINGYPDGSFRPYGKTTRAEAATMVVKAMKTYINPGSESDAEKIATDYLMSYFSGSKYDTIGSAEKDYEYIRFTYEKARENGYEIKNIPSDFVIDSISVDGAFSAVVVSYTVTHERDGYIKSYNGKSEVKLVDRNGKMTVYEHNSQIIKPFPINMTWEVFVNPPSYVPGGVNIVSPTCFVVSDSDSKNGKSSYISDNLWFNSTLAENYVRYAKENNFEIWAMYKTDFDTDTATRILNNPEARKASAGFLIENILRFGLDGINFDFENMYASDKGAYTNHVKEIALIAHSLGVSVSVDVTRYEPTSMNWSMCYDRNALAKYADYMALMAYDQYYSGSKVSGPVAGLDWTRKSVEQTLKEVPGEKLILGMPFYIRCWKEKDGKVVSSEAISMTKAAQYAKENYAVVEYDSMHGLDKYSWWSGNYRYVFWMENAHTIAERAKIAREYGLAGVASWRRGFETGDVWQALSDVLFK